MGRRPVPGKTVQFIDVVSQSYRPRGCSPPSPLFARKTCNAQHVEELFSILVDDRFLQEPILIRDARFSWKTIKGVSRPHDGLFVSREHEEGTRDDINMTVDPGALRTTLDTVEPARWPPVVPVQRRDVLNTNDRALGHGIDTTIVIIEETRLKHVNVTVDVLRHHPICYENFIIASLTHASSRNETIWRNDHFEKSAQGILGSMRMSYVADAVSHFGNHPQC